MSHDQGVSPEQAKALEGAKEAFNNPKENKMTVTTKEQEEEKKRAKKEKEIAEQLDGLQEAREKIEDKMKEKQEELKKVEKTPPVKWTDHIKLKRPNRIGVTLDLQETFGFLPKTLLVRLAQSRNNCFIIGVKTEEEEKAMKLIKEDVESRKKILRVEQGVAQSNNKFQ